MDIWTEKPKNFDVTHSTTLELQSAHSFTVEVEDQETEQIEEATVSEDAELNEIEILSNEIEALQQQSEE